MQKIAVLCYCFELKFNSFEKSIKRVQTSR